MKKPFNASLSDDISRLKTIHNNAGACADYRNLFRNIMDKHKISRSTVYAELAKSLPGMYKSQPARSVRTQVGEHELAMVRALFHERKTNKEIRQAMEREMGFPYSERRLKRAKLLITLMNAKKMITTGMPSDATPAPPEMCRLFHKLAALDTSNLKRKHTIDLDDTGTYVTLSSLVIKNSLDNLALSASYNGMHLHEISRYEMETILMRQIQSVKAGTYITPAGLKALEATRRSLEKSESTSTISAAGYEALFSTVRHFSPDATRAEITRVLDSYLESENCEPDSAIGAESAMESDRDANKAA